MLRWQFILLGGKGLGYLRLLSESKGFSDTGKGIKSVSRPAIAVTSFQSVVPRYHSLVVTQWVWSLAAPSLGRLSNDDGSANEDVTWKYIFISFVLLIAIVSTRSTFTKMANYPGTKLVRAGYKLRKKMNNSPSCVHVLHKILNLVISRGCFAEDGKEMYQNVNARAERLFLLIKPIVLRRCRCRRRRRCLSSLIIASDRQRSWKLQLPYQSGIFELRWTRVFNFLRCIPSLFH